MAVADEDGMENHDLKNVGYDPNNARQRTPRSAGIIKASLDKFGPLRSLVGHYDDDGKLVIRAGNGTLKEAESLGIKKIRPVVRNRDELVVVVANDLTDEQWTEYAIVDNLSSDLSEWDQVQLKQTHEEEVDLGDWFTAEEIAEWDDEPDLPPTGNAPTGESATNFAIVIECVDKNQQLELLERFAEEGLECQALVS